MYVAGAAYGRHVGELSAAEWAVLAFEAEHPEPGPRKNEAIRLQLQLSPGRYYQVLERLADSVEALRADPVLIHRVQRVREERARARQQQSAPSA